MNRLTEEKLKDSQEKLFAPEQRCEVHLGISDLRAVLNQRVSDYNRGPKKGKTAAGKLEWAYSQVTGIREVLQLLERKYQQEIDERQEGY